MLINYCKVAWRNLLKNRLSSFINILGLSIGVTVCLLILLFIKYEKNWDRMHTRSNLIYRVNELQNFPGSSIVRTAFTMFPMGPTLKQDFAQVDKFVGFFPHPRNK